MEQSNYRICDSHTHIFPQKISHKATTHIGEFYGIEMAHEANASELIAEEAQIGTARMLVCGAATTEHQVASINTFIAGECALHDCFVGFGTLHPSMNDFESEISRILSLGLKGIKLHPDFQNFAIDEPRAVEMYSELASAGLPVLFHMGDERYDRSSPARLVRVLDRIPKLTAIAAHFGGYSQWEEVWDYPQTDRLYFDTSSALFKLPAETAAKLIEYYGATRFMFGTDFPMWDAASELARFMALPLDEETRRKILSANFDALFPKN